MVIGMGDARQFEAFFASTKDRVFRAVLVSVRDRALAEDAVSEAYTRALDDWVHVAVHPVPVAWVVRTAMNVARSHQRRTRRVVLMSPPEIGVHDEPPTDPDLVGRVLALPERQRQVVGLRILLDLSTEQTADLLGIAPGTVTAHLYRALSRIETDLTRESDKESWL